MQRNCTTCSMFSEVTPCCDCINYARWVEHPLVGLGRRIGLVAAFKAGKTLVRNLEDQSFDLDADPEEEQSLCCEVSGVGKYLESVEELFKKARSDAHLAALHAYVKKVMDLVEARQQASLPEQP